MESSGGERWFGRLLPCRKDERRNISRAVADKFIFLFGEAGMETGVLINHRTIIRNDSRLSISALAKFLFLNRDAVKINSILIVAGEEEEHMVVPRLFYIPRCYSRSIIMRMDRVSSGCAILFYLDRK
jgi:hypothetical protein